MSLDQRWQARLDQVRDEGRHRCLTQSTGLDFSSNDYLGYASLASGGREPSDDAVRGLTPPARLARSGAASRLLRGQHPIWDEVESALAAWHGAEAALVFNSGYVANEGLLSTIIEPDDWVASDQCNHASIIDGLRLSKAERFIFRHNDLAHLESGLHGAAGSPARFIVTESLFGMEGDRAPLTALVELAQRYGAQVIVDEAHATGCFGPTGSGLVDDLGLRPGVLATVHTGGKALGVTGAYVVGSRLLKELLINRCRHFMFTTALAPIIGAWWLESLEHARDDESARRKLHMNAAIFRELLSHLQLHAGGTDYIVPLILGDDARAVAAAQALQDNGFDVRAIRPPSVAPGSARLRIAIHADQEPRNLQALALALRNHL